MHPDLHWTGEGGSPSPRAAGDRGTPEAPARGRPVRPSSPGDPAATRISFRGREGGCRSRGRGRRGRRRCGRRGGQDRPPAARTARRGADADRAARLATSATRARSVFGDRVVWHDSSTASGGGVAEMLQTLLATATAPASRTAGWSISVSPGIPVDHQAVAQPAPRRGGGRRPPRPGRAGLLRSPARSAICGPFSRGCPRPTSWVLHDPQTAGLAHGLREAGRARRLALSRGSRPPQRAHRRRVGLPPPPPQTLRMPTSSRAGSTRPPGLADRLTVIPPSIDPFSAKNTHLPPGRRGRSCWPRVGLRQRAGRGAAGGTSGDGTAPRGSIRHHHGDGGLVVDGPPPPADAPLVVQVSRWDRLKDMAGVITGFVEMLRQDLPSRLAPDARRTRHRQAWPTIRKAHRCWPRVVSSGGSSPAGVRSRVHLTVGAHGRSSTRTR